MFGILEGHEIPQGSGASAPTCLSRAGVTPKFKGTVRSVFFIPSHIKHKANPIASILSLCSLQTFVFYKLLAQSIVFLAFWCPLLQCSQEGTAHQSRMCSLMQPGHHTRTYSPQPPAALVLSSAFPSFCQPLYPRLFPLLSKLCVLQHPAHKGRPQISLLPNYNTAKAPSPTPITKNSEQLCLGPVSSCFSKGLPNFNFSARKRKDTQYPSSFHSLPTKAQSLESLKAGLKYSKIIKPQQPN